MTSLSQQLKELETPQTNLLSHNIKRKSILFSQSETQNHSKDVYFKIGKVFLK